MRPPTLRIRQTVRAGIGELFTAFFMRCKRNCRPNFPFSLKKLPVSNGQELARWRMSLKVAKIINIRTIANPMRKPSSWARSDSGRPRIASIA